MLRITMRRAGAAVVIALAVSSAAHAGAGLRSGGDLLYSMRAGYLFADQEWDGERDLRDSDCRSEYTNNSHALEYGYNYYSTFYGQLGLARSACASDSKTGLTDLKLGIRSRLNIYENDGSWEIETTIPTANPRPGERKIGCHEFGVAGSVHKRFEPTQRLDTDLGATVQMWGGPLAEQLRVSAGLGYRLPGRWSVTSGLQGTRPISSGSGDPESLISDCGTEGRSLRGTADLKYRYSDFLHLGCGMVQTLWGENVSRTRGLSCGFSYLWKD